MRYKIIILIFLVYGLAWGETNKMGTSAGGFLNIEVGAKAIGMGGAFVAYADDPTALFWNPAAITSLQGTHFVFNHDEYLADMSFDYVGAIFNMGNYGSFGASVTSLSMDEMKITNYLYPQGTGATFDAGSFAVGGYYAYSLTDRFSIGGGIKYVKEKIYNCDAKSVAFDVGTIFTTQFYGTRIGMSITNFGPKLKMSGTDLIVNYDYDPDDPFNNDKINADLRTDSYEMPLMFRVGIALDLLRNVEQQSFWVAVDAMHPNDNSECVNVGGEYGMRDMFFLRGGYKAAFQEDSEQDWTCGGGLKVDISGSKIRFDYAYQNFGRLENVQKVTVSLGF